MTRAEQQWWGGTAELLDELYEAHAKALFGFVLPAVNGDRQTAEDIVQETMLRAWRNAGTVATADSPRAWLFAVAQRLVVDRWRSRNARPQEVVDTPLLYMGMADHTDRTLSRIVVREALAALTPKYRATIVEIFLRDRSEKEAAAVLGIPVGTVKSRLHAALRTLRVAIDTKGGD